MSIKRYDIDQVGHPFACLDGGWIFYPDHIAALEAVKATGVTQDMVDELVNAELDEALSYTGGGAPSLEKEGELKRELTRAREVIRQAFASPALEANQQVIKQQAENLTGIIDYMEKTNARQFEPWRVVFLTAMARDALLAALTPQQPDIKALNAAIKPGMSDGAIYAAMSRAQFTDEENAAFDADIISKGQDHE